MVEGLDKFREFLGSYSDNYIIIGGTACNVILENAGTVPRVTHDIDMIVVVEHLTKDFVSAFWTFIRKGGYTIEKRQHTASEPAYALYRFRKPSETGYPSQIELLARHSDSLGEPKGVRIEPVPMEDYQYNLSAIVMVDDLYQLVVSNSKLMNGIRIASLESLICLKARAYLNLLKERETGKQVNSDDIKKHRRDVILLVAARTETEPISVPVSILTTVNEFLQLMNTEESSSSLMSSLRIDREQLNAYLEALGELFIKEDQP